MTARAVYEVTKPLIDWMTNELESIEQSTFVHFRESYQLINIVTAAENGRIPKFAALSAIRQHNELNGSDLTYEAILNLDATYVFSDFGEWVVFTDDPRAIICGEYDEAEDACSNTPDHVAFVLVWDTLSDEVIVYKSPWTGKRASTLGGNFSIGTQPGDLLSYVLPPNVEASLYENDLVDGEIDAR